MHKSARKYNEILDKWCKNKHGASKIMDTFETYQAPAGERHDLMHPGEFSCIAPDEPDQTQS
jgi:hypothetical protein